MKRNLVVALTLISLTIPGLMVQASSAEIDQEIDRLQVELQPAPHPKPIKVKRNQRKKSIRVASNQTVSAPATLTTVSQAPQAPVTDNGPTPETNQVLETPSQLKADSQAQAQADYSNSEGESVDSVSSKTYAERSRTSLLSRFTLIPYYAYGTFDGPDAGSVSTNNQPTSYTGAIAGSLLVDVNFGLQNFVAQTGVSYYQLGSYTGYHTTAFIGSSFGTASDEQIGLQYIGVPLNVKWLLSGWKSSSLFVKGGATPAMLLASQYSNLNGPAYIGNRFGGFTNFDVLLTAAVGYDFMVYKNYGVVVEAGYLHGVLPVANNYNIYNTAFTAGIGINYML